MLPSPTEIGLARDGNSSGWVSFLWDRLALIFWLSLLVSRWAVPPESAVLGDTLWLAVLAPLAAIFWLLGQIRRGPIRWQLGWPDLAVGLLIGGHLLGGLVVFLTAGDRRSAMSLICEWFGSATIYVLGRQLLVTVSARRQLLQTLVLTAVLMSGLGLYQHLWEFPELAREYDQLRSRYDALQAEGRPRFPEAAARWESELNRLQSQFVSLGIPLEGTARVLWEQRLLASREPLAFCALTNTLASLLLCGLILLGAEVAQRFHLARSNLAAEPVSETMPRSDRLGDEDPDAASADAEPTRKDKSSAARSRAVRSRSESEKAAAETTAADNPATGKRRFGWSSIRWRSIRWGEIDWIGGLWAAVLFALVGYVFLLTKSRTAYAAAGMAVLLVLVRVWLWQRLSLRQARTVLLVGLISLAGLAATASATGGLDRLVLLESGKSLRYRMEYWSSTLQMLGGNRGAWVTGVGLGNFRAEYLAFKLPQSSEEIADPHNAWLDVWSNGGLMGLVGLLGIAGIWCAIWTRRTGHPREESDLKDKAVAEADAADERPHRAGRSKSGNSSSADLRSPERKPARATDRLRSDSDWLASSGDGVRSVDGGPAGVENGWVSASLWGVVLGLTWPLWLGEFGDGRQKVLMAAAVLLVILRGLLLRGGAGKKTEPSAVGLAIAGLALCVHLSGAGGIGMPAVLQLLLVLLAWSSLAGRSTDAVSVDAVSTEETSPAAVTPPVKVESTFVGTGLVAGGVWVAGALVMLVVGARPVQEMNRWLETGDAAWFMEGDPAGAERAYRKAVAADDWSPRACERLGEFLLGQTGGDAETQPERFGRAVQWLEEAYRRDSRNAMRAVTIGQAYLLAAGVARDPVPSARTAVQWLERAVLRYPNSAFVQSLLAEAWDKAGDLLKARPAADRALELDEINRRAGHLDKQFPESRRNQLRRIAGQPDAPATPN